MEEDHNLAPDLDDVVRIKITIFEAGDDLAALISRSCIVRGLQTCKSFWLVSKIHLLQSVLQEKLCKTRLTSERLHDRTCPIWFC